MPLSSSKAGAIAELKDQGSESFENELIIGDNNVPEQGGSTRLTQVLTSRRAQPQARSAATDASTLSTENRWVFFSPPPQGPALGQWRIDKWNESEEIKRQDFLADQDKAAAKQAVVEQSQKQQAQAAKAQVKGKSSWFSWSTVKPAAAKPVAQSTANR